VYASYLIQKSDSLSSRDTQISKGATWNPVQSIYHIISQPARPTGTTMPEYQPFAVLPICGTSEINSFSSTKQESTLPGPALDKQRYQHTAIPYQHQHYTYGQPEPALVGQHYQQHTIPPQDQPYEQAGPALVGQHYQQHTTPPQHQAYVQAGPALVGHHYEQPPIPLHHQHHGHKPNLMMHPSQVEQPCLDQPFAVLPTCNTGEIGYFFPYLLSTSTTDMNPIL